MILNTMWPAPGLGEKDDEDFALPHSEDIQIDDLPEKSRADLEGGIAELQK